MAEPQDAIKVLQQRILNTQFDVSHLVEKTLRLAAEYSTISDISIKTLTKKYDTSTEKTVNKILEEDVPKTQYSIEADRARRYKTYEALLKIPAVGQALQTLADNISTPENITDKPVIIKKPLDLPTSETNEQIALIQTRIHTIINTLKFEDIIYKFSYDLPLYGDIFCEIENYQTVLKKEKFMESQSDSETSKLSAFVEIKFDENFNVIQTRDILQEYNEVFSFSKDTVLLQESGSDIDDDEDTLVPLSAIKLTVHKPSKVIIVHKYGTILGYIVIEVTKASQFVTGFSGEPNVGSPMGNTNDDSTQKIQTLADSILNALFKNKNHIVKKILEDDPEFLNYIGELVQAYSKSIKQINARFVHTSSLIHSAMPSSKYDPYGGSILDPITEIGKYILVGLRSTMLYRFTRAPDLRIFKVDIGADRDAMHYIQKVKEKIQQRKYAFSPDADLDALTSTLTMFDDLWVPTRNGQEFFQVENVPQGDLSSKLDDLKYMIDQAINGLGSIPPVYIASDRAADDRLTLAQQNARFAKTILSYQKRISSAIDTLVKTVYVMVYGSEPLLQGFTIKLPPPMSLFIERLSEAFSNIQNIITTFNELKIPKKYVLEFLSNYIDIEKINELEIIEDLEKIEQGTKKQENEEGISF